MSDEAEEWDFWDEANIHCAGYDSRLDRHAIDVLKAINAKKFNSDIASQLGLPGYYVELIQSIFCSMDWCDYGTSPRGCFINSGHDAATLIEKMEAWYQRKWSPDPVA